ncbi:hypothetical protein FE257_006736 [Aspergillus nanangensis]|uniref:FAD-binding domain-containing protein n=1 Tax=Aspergillus nanangensis TaxID=2582783 RepID=A0AAD4CP33_ASPNN|nr:hypothetical protein FE257_006736 [Aspergillus nanangensis]
MASNQNESPNGQASDKDDIIETDVLIVGAGVTGFTLSLLLADYGVKALTVAKHRGTAPSPRAHITNQRTVEIFRDMGIEQDIHAVSTPLTALGNCVMSTSMTAPEIARYSCYGAGNELETVLLARAHEKHADIRFSTALVAIEQDEEGVLATVRERLTNAEYRVRAKYAYGADGGRTAVADLLGFTFHGDPGLMNMMTCWIEVDLAQYAAHRPACMYWIVRPGNAFWVGSGTLITVKPFKEWLMNRQYDAADEPDMSEEAVIEYARSLIGIADAPVRVKDVSKIRWLLVNIAWAEFLLVDAYNIAWKLALVLSGHAEDQILDSYSQERQPVGKQIVDAAIQALYNMTRLPEALGFRRGQLEEEGNAALAALGADDPDAEKRRAELAGVVKLQDRRSNALGVQLGQRYSNSCAVCYDGTPFPAHQRDSTLFYEPTTHPGAYLPHVWVEHEGRRISTLDIFPFGTFGLIVGVGGGPFVAAAQQVAQETGIAIPVYDVGSRCTYNDVLGEWRTACEISDRGALLVRPDRFVAWRSVDRPSDPLQALRSAVCHILGLK